MAKKNFVLPKDPKVVVIGGGSGTAAIYPEVAHRTKNAVAIVGMSDSGGSTGIISNELDMVPVGDLRNVMLAASRNPYAKGLQDQKLGGKGSLFGHSASNLVLATFIEKYGVAEGVDVAGKFFDVPGTVLPVTLDRHDLMMQDGDKVLRGEHVIDEYVVSSKEPRVWLDPEVNANDKALEALKEADLIVIAGGSVYTSQLAALSVPGIKEALAASSAPKVLLTNLATEQHQTDNWHAVDFVKALRRHGVAVDHVLYNVGRPTAAMLANYKAAGQQPVGTSASRFTELPSHIRLTPADILARNLRPVDKNDRIKKRGLMLHDAKAVGDELWKILAEPPVQKAAPTCDIAEVQVPHIHVPLAYAVDMDRTLAIDAACNDRLFNVAEEYGVDIAAIKRAQQQIEDAGTSFSPLQYVQDALADADFNAFGQAFIEHAPELAYADTPLFLDSQRGIPHLIPTYGVETLWQLMKAAAFDPRPKYVEVMPDSNKGGRIEEWRGPQGTFDFIGMDDAGAPVGVYHAKQVLLVDDKTSSHNYLPADCKGALLVRPDEPRMKSQAGVIPEHLTRHVTTVSGLDELAGVQPAELLTCGLVPADIPPSVVAFRPAYVGREPRPGVLLTSDMSFMELRAVADRLVSANS